MTRQEITNLRPREFSKWIREYLPDSSTGFCVCDLDWVMFNVLTKELILLEEKTRNGQVANWFRLLIRNVIHPALKEYCPKHGIKYYGFHLIQFENTSPIDGEIYFDYKKIDVQKLIKILSFEHFKDNYH